MHRPPLSAFREVLLAAVLFTAAAPLATLPARGAEPFRLDGDGACLEQRVDVAARPGGGFVAVWAVQNGEDGSQGTTVVGRLYDAGAVAAGPPFPMADHEVARAVPAVAVQPDGSFLVAWGDPVRLPPRLYWQTFDAAGAPVGPNRTDGVIDAVYGLEAVAGPAGDYLLLATGYRHGILVDSATLHRLTADGTAAGSNTFWHEPLNALISPALAAGAGAAYGGAAVLFPGTVAFTSFDGLETSVPSFGVRAARDPALAVLPNGDVVAAFTRIDEERAATSLALELRSPAGELLETVRVDDGGWTELSPAQVAAGPAGRFVVVWAERLATGNTRLRARGFLPDGTPAGPPRTLFPTAAAADDAGQAAPWLPDVAWTGGEWTVVWQDGERDPYGPQGHSLTCFSGGIHGLEVVDPQLFPGPALALQDGRFEARVAWRDPYNDRSGVGHPLPLTDDTGTFWFFREGNRELMVKVLDGRALNDAFWVFYGSTTSVVFDLVVTDTETGDEAVYRNPPFHLASRGDTSAFPQPVPTDGEAAGTLTAAARPAPPALFGQSLPAFSILPLDRLAGRLTPAVPSFDCDDPAEPGLCLGASYEVTVRWFDPFNGGSGEGHGVALSEDSGYFWFFRPGNAELLVKMVAGGPVNGHDWVFYGSLTNVAFEMRVYDWNTGFERLYRNPPRQFRSVGDTRAFPPTGGCEAQCPAGGEPVCGNDGLTYANACLAECSGRTVLHAGACTWEPPQ